MKHIVSSIVAALIAVTVATAAEYFVAVDGSDAAAGTSPDAAFATIQRGVDALEPGDILTIMPGEYFESVSRVGLGSADADTLIRAELPGTVLLRGDVAAPRFEKTLGYRFVWQAEFAGPVQAVNELDTLLILEAVSSVEELEFDPGHYYFDEEKGILYIASTDLKPPQEHVYTVSVLGGRSGIFLQRANRVTIEGLTVTGFNSAVPLPRMDGGNSISDIVPLGIFLSQCTNSVISGCTAYLNAGGLIIQSGNYGSDNRVEYSLAFGNQSTLGNSGGNITVFNPHRDEVRGCVAFHGQRHGIRMHGSSPDPEARFSDCLSWGHIGADFQLKTDNAEEKASADRCISPQSPIIKASGYLPRTTNSLAASGNTQPGNNIVLEDYSNLDMAAEFADPVNMDFRLQSTSCFRGAGEDGSDLGPIPYSESVYFVSPTGNDAADGLSMASAWRTPAHAVANIKAGDTLYFEPGTYKVDAPLRIPEGAIFLGRGHGIVRFTGPVTIENSDGVTFERVEFRDGVTVRGSNAVQFINCAFAGRDGALRLDGVDVVQITRCMFSSASGPALRTAGASGLFLQANIFGTGSSPAVEIDDLHAIIYSDFNSFSNGEAVWLEGGEVLPLAQVLVYAESNSIVAVPDFDSDSLLPGPRNRLAFYLPNPQGVRIGYYNPTVVSKDDLDFTGPFLHSVSATTANIEWWSSRVETFTVEWGTTPEYGNQCRLESTPAYHPGDPRGPFTTFSLQDLAPGTTYYARILQNGVELGALSFTTLAQDLPPRTLFVATDGDDANDGLSRGNALLTISRAAELAQPGDEVVVDSGEYNEMVRVRATGSEGHPIVFRSAPGAKVVVTGGKRTLSGAFSIANKGYIVIDGFYFEEFQRLNNQGIIRINNSNDIVVERCFFNSRGGGSPEAITIGSSDGVLIRNCATVAGWDGFAAGRSRNIVIENCVIVRSAIRPIPIEASSDATVRNTIITDNLPTKRNSFLVPDNPGITLENNCFFLRWPEAERRVFGRDTRTLAEYEAERRIAVTNLLRDPRFRLAVASDTISPDGLFLDSIVNGISDFNDLFATDEELIRRNIGLQLGAFEGFHFNSN